MSLVSVAAARFSAATLRRRLLILAVLLAVSALPVLFLMPLFTAPFERDQGLYGVIARGWMQGAVPYRDLWDNKGPVLFLWYVAAFKLLGEGVVAPRLLAALGTAAAVPFVWDSARILLGPRKGLLAALFFAIAFANPFLQANANAEILMLCPLAAGFWAFTRGSTGGGQLWFALAGVLTALAALTKQAAAGPLAGYGVWLVVLALRHPAERPRHLRSMLMLAAGVAVGLSPFVVYFAVNGALYDFFYATVKFNILFSGGNPIILKLIPTFLVDPPSLFGGLLLWVLAVIGAVRLWPRRDRATGLILTFALFSELAAQFMGKVSAHYNVGLVPAAAILGAVGFDAVVDAWRGGRRRLGYAAMACAVISVAVSAFVYARPSSEDRFVVQYTYRDYAYRSLDAREIADRVDALTRPDDYVYEFGRQSDIYFLANRKPASRWVHARAYGIDPTMMDEVLNDLRAKQPKLILLTFECEPMAHDFEGCEAGPPQPLKDYLDANYHYAGRVDYADFYLRLDQATTGTSSTLLVPGGQL
jgi:4-amino-4-deoxy-L-arabinose transferase-like glycosyltransferase